jgi:hypothetical protein
LNTENQTELKEDFSCMHQAHSTFTSNSNYLDKCDCPIECERTYFQYTSSIAEFPTLKYSKYLMNASMFVNSNLTYQELKESVARVEIFYDELKQTIISESIKTELSDLIANLGGTLGLFLGLSFLSLVEFVEILLQALLVALKKHDTKNNNRINDKHSNT